MLFLGSKDVGILVLQFLKRGNLLIRQCIERSLGCLMQENFRLVLGKVFFAVSALTVCYIDIPRFSILKDPFAQGGKLP
jgi:hypothetical protein